MKSNQLFPIIAIVGRPNVGKSTLFNVLTRDRKVFTLVDNFPGVTRDRQYGKGIIGGCPYFIVDTGGLEEDSLDELVKLTKQQVQEAIDEADIILFMVDWKTGLTLADQSIAKRLRPYRAKVTIVVNKNDYLEESIACSDFFELGLGNPIAIAAKRKRGIKNLMQQVLKDFLKAKECLISANQLTASRPLKSRENDEINVTLVGRPNVGKSTLINRLLGKERVIVSDKAGTTRDAISVSCTHQGQCYQLTDTAGIRRHSKINSTIEKLSVIKTVEAMHNAHVILMLLNAREDISNQDMRLLGLIMQTGKAVIVVVNQWDKLTAVKRRQIKHTINRRLSFFDFSLHCFISALHGTGVEKLYDAINTAYQSARRDLGSGELTRALQKAVQEHSPPVVRGRRIRLRYAHLGGHHPMVIIIHGKRVETLTSNYRRYLAHYFRRTFKLLSVPLVIFFKNNDANNPYL